MKVYLHIFVIAISFVITSCGSDGKDIDYKDLPIIVQRGIDSTFSKAEVISAEQIIEEDGKITYELMLKQNNILYMNESFDANGKYLGKEKK